jgi:hypothetical protein
MQLDLKSLKEIPKKVRIDVNSDDLQIAEKRRSETIQLPKYADNTSEEEVDKVSFQWQKILQDRQAPHCTRDVPDSTLKHHICSILAPYYVRDYMLPGTTLHDIVKQI